MSPKKKEGEVKLSELKLDDMTISEANRTKAFHKTILKTVFNELEVRDLTGHLVGQILTIVDTAMEDPVRRKAMKDLIVDRLWDANWKLIDWMEDGGKEENFPYRTYAYNPDEVTSGTERVEK